jgi:phage-related protein
MRTPAHGEQPLYWVGSAKRGLLTFPESVKDGIGTALSVAQFGGKHPAAKPWKGVGPGVLEVVEDHDGNTYRAVYTVRFRWAVYVLHCFGRNRVRASDAEAGCGAHFTAPKTGQTGL